ncbi:MAG: hypothetical protein E7813_15915 [Bradyrhizobium sp.]|uniref:hypothetical protein n=1 Tax=Bradyrhizobium sp. TaxID=376 RepID=UPI00122B8DDE|nr:hypothetical protein [Bradyrhizobium sp.]THD65120.1 MAG: hypothetical protein E7813_15915 [Bradyrhizobium sp.]
MPLEVPQPGVAGWFVCPEPSSSDPQTSALEIAVNINKGIETLQSSYAPHVVMVFYPSRWRDFRGMPQFGLEQQEECGIPHL